MRDSEPSDVSAAVVLFLGFGTEMMPGRLFDRLVSEFGSGRARQLAERVVELTNEIARVHVDWSEHTLVSGTALARTEMQKQHPELSDAALDALAWQFSFDWR